MLFSSLKDIEELHAKAVETGILHYVIDNSFANLDEKKCEPSVAKCVHDALNAAYQRHEVRGENWKLLLGEKREFRSINIGVL